MKQKLLITLISSAFLLSACGGSDGDSNGSDTHSGNGNGGQTTNPKDDLGQSTGSVIEPLDLNHKYNVLYSFAPSTGLVSDTEVKQDLKGIITSFDAYQIKGDIIAKEIQGNKNYALARLAKAIVEKTDSKTGKVETTELSKYVNDSYYYFVYTPLAKKLIADGKTIQCTDLNSTQARLTNGGNNSNFITPTIRNASINIKEDGRINAQFTVQTNNGETTYLGSIPWSDYSNSYNNFNMLGISTQSGQSNQNGLLAVSKNGDNSIVLGASYHITLANQAKYEGLASMTCNF
ncbi:hypothetical protein [Acinetobacter rudis]|uniref:Lipoprotein n=1 Tax=Acinetobacter rudis TaxID=632955 RepID=A0AAW8J8K0_9GAMM|nr:hypothetical protein [Acinetobacter rudis]MDQ8935489.1 hypothetical protein [Acinetobacter rudis]MDQ9017744.1 hypothetical protein [Acinetobacter rudis]